MLADHVQANEQQAFFAQGRADLFGNPAIAVSQWAGFATAASGQVATGFTAGRNARQAVRHWLAIDHQNTLVAILDGGQVGLRHDLLGAKCGQGFENHREVRVAHPVAKDRGAAHAVQWLEDHVAMFGDKLANDVRAAADQGRRGALREQRGEQLFVAVAQALWAVDHQHTSGFGLFEQVGAVDKLHVEWRILAHQDHVQIAQGVVFFGFQLEPVLRVGEDLQRAHPRAGLALALVEVLLLHVEQRPAALLGGKQHGQRAILLIGNARNGVHDNPEANAHGLYPLGGDVPRWLK
ncbi:hypothetical protein D3C80_1054410 [compost metagenome]